MASDKIFYMTQQIKPPLETVLDKIIHLQQGMTHYVF